MMGIISFLQKRPSDNVIYFGRIIFGLILIFSLYYNLIIQGDKIENDFIWLFNNVTESTLNIIMYILVALGIIPVVMGLVRKCFLKKKYMRIIQIVFGIFLLYISTKIIPSDANKLDVDSLIAFLAFLPLIAGITGKCIASKCLKYGEKVTKIRI
ncbi:MAG: hypothetical protein Q9M94_01865 [Candidatus Gracilibacteria bacterium]|nr:hypothetical protein [Candidatus Gracilibacteria bacterium]MDQ7022931.1 hypothetical protein [Candidatus Gracilibacteria bacterium]